MLELPIKATRSPNEGSAVVSITYRSSISYWLTLHKVSFSPILFSSYDRLPGGVSGGSLLFIERAPPKVPAVFWTRVWGEGKRVGKEKNWVMSLNGESVFKVRLPFLPLIRRSPQRQASEENLCPQPQMRSREMRVPGLGMCNHLECPSHCHTSLQRLQCLPCTRRSAWPWEACCVNPLHCPGSGLGKSQTHTFLRGARLLNHGAPGRQG